MSASHSSHSVILSSSHSGRNQIFVPQPHCYDTAGSKPAQTLVMHLTCKRYMRCTVAYPPPFHRLYKCRDYLADIPSGPPFAGWACNFHGKPAYPVPLLQDPHCKVDLALLAVWPRFCHIYEAINTLFQPVWTQNVRTTVMRVALVISISGQQTRDNFSSEKIFVCSTKINDTLFTRKELKRRRIKQHVIDACKKNCVLPPPSPCFPNYYATFIWPAFQPFDLGMSDLVSCPAVHAPRQRMSGGLTEISCHKGVSSKCIIIVPRMQLSGLFSICCSDCCVALTSSQQCSLPSKYQLLVKKAANFLISVFKHELKQPATSFAHANSLTAWAVCK